MGANIGDALATLGEAVALINALPTTRLDALSSAYVTPPWGDPDQPDYINAVVRVETALSATALLAGLHAIEARLGRERDPGRRWGPRVIDLDVLVHGVERADRPELTLPHPRLDQRAFVLVPLAELDPDLEVPGRGQVGALLAALPAAELEAVRPIGALRHG